MKTISKHRKPRKMTLDNGIYKVPLRAEKMSERELDKLMDWAQSAWLWKVTTFPVVKAKVKRTSEEGKCI